MEDTMLELIEVCRQKEFHCMHDNVDDLIESALNSKLLLINLESQRPDKKKQEVKNVVEQPIEPEEPEYSLSMGYEHLSTISKMEFDEVIKSSVKNLLPIPSEYEVTSDDESKCDVSVKDESSSVFTTFSNPLFDDNDDFTSSDDESLSNVDVLMEDFKVYSNSLFDDEEINSDKLNPYCFNVESDFVESLFYRDTLIDSSLKFDFLEEFSGAFMPTSVADEERIRRELAEYISLIERIVTLKREEIAIFTGTDELLPLSIESDNYDSEGEINEEIDVFTNLEDDDYFPFIFVIRIFLPYLIYPEVSPLLLFTGSEDTIFDPGKDYAKTIKNQSKPGNIGHEIESLHQKPDQKAFFYNNQANEAKCQKIKSSRAILANSAKSKSKEKVKIKVKDHSCEF
nr:hypothetical protein [Tanacetum cinerariifolium]